MSVASKDLPVPRLLWPKCLAHLLSICSIPCATSGNAYMGSAIPMTTAAIPFYYTLGMFHGILRSC